MKAYRYILFSIFGLLITNLSAQDKSNAPDSVFFEYAKSLKDRGNDYYMLCNRTGIKQVIDEYRLALEQRKAAGNLTNEMEGYFMQDILKLRGDYHYLNSDYVTDKTCRGYGLVYYDEEDSDYVVNSYINCKHYTTKNFAMDFEQ